MPPKVFSVLNIERRSSDVRMKLAYIAAMTSQEAEAVWQDDHRPMASIADTINKLPPGTTVSEAYILTDEHALQTIYASAPDETMGLAMFAAWEARIARGPVFNEVSGEYESPGWRRITTADPMKPADGGANANS